MLLTFFFVVVVYSIFFPILKPIPFSFAIKVVDYDTGDVLDVIDVVDQELEAS